MNYNYEYDVLMGDFSQKEPHSALTDLSYFCIIYTCTGYDYKCVKNVSLLETM